MTWPGGEEWQKTQQIQSRFHITTQCRFIAINYKLANIRAASSCWLASIGAATTAGAWASLRFCWRTRRGRRSSSSMSSSESTWLGLINSCSSIYVKGVYGSRSPQAHAHQRVHEADLQPGPQSIFNDFVKAETSLNNGGVC